MALNKNDVVGLATGAAAIHVERGPVGQFASAVTYGNPTEGRRAWPRSEGPIMGGESVR